MSVQDEMLIEELYERNEKLEARNKELEGALNEAADDVYCLCDGDEIRKARRLQNKYRAIAKGESK